MTIEITREQLNEIVEDAAYLQVEAESLRSVIETVPYDVSPPEDLSIHEKLLLLDYLQANYYRPLFEQVACGSAKSIRAEDYSSFSKNFHVEEIDKPDIQNVLVNLAKHRASLVNVLRQIPIVDWQETVLHKENRMLSLYEFVWDMIHNDRKILKEIADLVLVFQKDSQSEREIKMQSSQKWRRQNFQ